MEREGITQITIHDQIAVATIDRETEVLEVKATEEGCVIAAQGNQEAVLTIYSKRQPVLEKEPLACENGGCRIQIPLCGRKEIKLFWRN